MEHMQVQSNREIHGVKVHCAGVYEQNVQKLIRGLKYHNQKDLAYFQAKFMHDYWEKTQNSKSFQVVPVPLFKKREKERKYNHMALVAEEFCKLTGYELNLGLIERIKDTKPQYKLSKKQRTENLQNAFRIDKTKCLNKDILIIDDICTTGSTFENMIVELNKNGIDNIVCFATTTPFQSEEIL